MIRRLAIVCLAVLMIPFAVVVAITVAVRTAWTRSHRRSCCACPLCGGSIRAWRVLERGPGREPVDAPYDAWRCAGCGYGEILGGGRADQAR